MSEVENTEVEATEVTEASKRINIPTDKYQQSRTATGGKSMHNGDVVATGLAGRTLDQVYEMASEMLDTEESELREKYAHLNVGQQRMNLGNRIRGAVNRMNKKAETEEGKKDGAISGDSYFEQLSDGYPAPELPKKEAKKAEAEEADEESSDE
jgi:hypothetical protein